MTPNRSSYANIVMRADNGVTVRYACYWLADQWTCHLVADGAPARGHITVQAETIDEAARLARAQFERMLTLASLVAGRVVRELESGRIDHATMAARAHALSAIMPQLLADDDEG